MAITHSALAHAMARDFLKAAPPEARVRRVWVWSQFGYVDPERDYVEMFVFADPVDKDAEQRLDRAASVLDENYPDVLKMAYLLGVNVPGGRMPEDWVRPEAEEISLDDE